MIKAKQGPILSFPKVDNNKGFRITFETKCASSFGDGDGKVNLAYADAIVITPNAVAIPSDNCSTFSINNPGPPAGGGGIYKFKYTDRPTPPTDDTQQCGGVESCGKSNDNYKCLLDKGALPKTKYCFDGKPMLCTSGMVCNSKGNSQNNVCIIPS